MVDGCEMMMKWFLSCVLGCLKVRFGYFCLFDYDFVFLQMGFSIILQTNDDHDYIVIIYQKNLLFFYSILRNYYYLHANYNSSLSPVDFNFYFIPSCLDECFLYPCFYRKYKSFISKLRYIINQQLFTNFLFIYFGLCYAMLNSNFFYL